LTSNGLPFAVLVIGRCLRLPVAAALLASAWLATAAIAAEPQGFADRLAEATLLHRAGRFDDALRVLTEVRRLAEAAGDQRLFAASSNDLGRTLLAAGRTTEAQPWLERSLASARTHGLVEIEAVALNNLGNLAEALGQPDRALASFLDVQRLADGAEPAAVGAAALNAGRLLLDHGDREAARRQLDAAHAALARQAPTHDQILQQLGLGRQWARLGEAAAAHEALAAARAMAERLDEPRLTSFALGYLGALYDEQGRSQEALTLVRQALFAAQVAAAPDALYRWHRQLGRLLVAEGAIDQGIEAYRQAAAILAVLRPELTAEPTEHRRRTLREEVQPVYLELADLLLRRAAAAPAMAAQQGDLDEARRTIEALRAAELKDYFQDDCVTQLQAKAKPIDRLDPDTAALYPIILPERLVLLLSLPDGLVQVPVPIDEAALADRARRLRLLLEKRTTHEYLPDAQALYDLVIRPVEPRLAAAGISTLVVIPDGPLRTVPLAALHDGKAFLIDRYALGTVPGLSLTEPTRLAEIELNPLLNGLTEAVQSYPPLPFIGAELDEIARLLGGKTLRDQTFVVSELQQSLAAEPYTVVHIASHAQFGGDAADTFLLTYDGRLDLDHLERFINLSRFRDEPIELLALSACRTAAGDERAALGMAGVAVKAGARSALATLWFINDEASSQVVSRFYRMLRAQPVPTKAKALQEAKLQVKSDLRYRHPAYWAPFLLIGNWL
jgi:CHAT domain-containing protein